MLQVRTVSMHWSIFMVRRFYYNLNKPQPIRTVQQLYKMQKSVHVKDRSFKRFNSTCLSIERPLAFSIELKPNSHSHIGSPMSQSQNLKQKKSVGPEDKKRRVMSAQVTNSSVKALSGKPYINWGLNNVEQVQKQDIKWIGVHPNPKNSESIYTHAFPRRQQKNADQSFANFMLRYGRCFKNAKESQNILKSSQMRPDKNLVLNAATVKVKPRLTWFGRKKCPSNQKSRLINRSELEVVWSKNYN